MSSAPDLTSRLLRHERAIVAASVVLLAAVAWWFIASGAGMDDSPGMSGMRVPPLGSLILMWWLMMAAMMLPSAAPMILLYGRVRDQQKNRGAIAQSWVFLAGYLTIWLAFSILAASAQQLLTGASMALESPALDGAVRIATGLYQLSPLKSACLRQCRLPADFLTRHWRPGWDGAARLGVLHGAYCVGCCWLLMTLLFVVGVMNLLWIVALTAIVAIEKLTKHGPFIGRASGVALVAWGILKVAGF